MKEMEKIILYLIIVSVIPFYSDGKQDSTWNIHSNIIERMYKWNAKFMTTLTDVGHALLKQKMSDDSVRNRPFVYGTLEKAVALQLHMPKTKMHPDIVDTDLIPATESTVTIGVTFKTNKIIDSYQNPITKYTSDREDRLVANKRFAGYLRHYFTIESRNWFPRRFGHFDVLASSILGKRNV